MLKTGKQLFSTVHKTFTYKCLVSVYINKNLRIIINPIENDIATTGTYCYLEYKYYNLCVSKQKKSIITYNVQKWLFQFAL